MTTATVLCVFLLCACMCAAADQQALPGFACNLKAISAAERPRYDDLAKRIRAAVGDHKEIAEGFAFKLDSKTVSLAEAAEWISMERLCCPFLTMQLTASGTQNDWTLTLTGPAGVKPLIASEFPAREHNSSIL